MEQLFVNCVEDVRKDIIRRRLKAEVSARKKMGQSQVTSGIGKVNSNRSMQQSISQMTDMSADAKEFEETLSKLADLAKNRVKFEEFTSVDRSHLLDLFVNNEQTLLKIYEVLFPQPSFKQAQVLKNPSDQIKFNLNELSARSGLGINDSITMATGASIDQVSEVMMPHQQSPFVGAEQSSFDFGALPQGSQLNTERESQPDGGRQIWDGATSGGLKVSQLNNKSTTLPSIYPGASPNTQSDVKILRNSKMFEAANRSPQLMQSPGM